MTAPDTVIFNTRETIVASDLNRVGGLAGKAVQDSLAGIEGGLEYSPRPCTRRGLLATPGAGMSVDISSGELMVFDTTITSIDSSPYSIGRLLDSAVVALTPADVTDARIDTIYAIIGQLATDAIGIRQVLSLPSRAVSGVAVNKSSRPILTLGVATGTPGVPPGFNGALPAGAIVLWHVYVPANSVVVSDENLMDGRYRFHPNALGRKHAREVGLYPSPPNDIQNQMKLCSGRAFVNGALLELNTDLIGSLSSFMPTGSGALLPDTEYSVYVMGPGMGPQLALSKATSCLAILASGNTPTGEGRPSSPLSFRPLPGIDDTVIRTTTDALYVGTLHTDGGALLQFGGDAMALNRDGTERSALLTPADVGFAGRPNVWLREPTLRWIDSNTVGIDGGVVMMRGVPGVIPSPLTATMPASLVAGEVESASTFYYVYLRSRVPGQVPRGAIRSYQLVISSEPPTIYGTRSATGLFDTRDFLFIGSIYNDASLNITQFVRIGTDVRWQTSLTIMVSTAIAEAPLFTTVTARVPNTARSVHVEHGSVLSPTSGFARVGYNVFPGTAIAIPSSGGWLYADFSSSLSGIFVSQDEVVVNQAKQYRVSRNPISGTATFFLGAFQNGYTEVTSDPVNPLP